MTACFSRKLILRRRLHATGGHLLLVKQAEVRTKRQDGRGEPFLPNTVAVLAVGPQGRHPTTKVLGQGLMVPVVPKLDQAGTFGRAGSPTSSVERFVKRSIVLARNVSHKDVENHVADSTSRQFAFQRSHH